MEGRELETAARIVALEHLMGAVFQILEINTLLINDLDAGLVKARLQNMGYSENESDMIIERAGNHIDRMQSGV